MKEEYIKILISFLSMLGLIAIMFLIADLGIDGIFVVGMLISLPILSILHLTLFMIQSFQLNYKIIKR